MLKLLNIQERSNLNETWKEVEQTVKTIVEEVFLGISPYYGLCQ